MLAEFLEHLITLRRDMGDNTFNLLLKQLTTFTENYDFTNSNITDTDIEILLSVISASLTSLHNDIDASVPLLTYDNDLYAYNSEWEHQGIELLNQSSHIIGEHKYREIIKPLFDFIDIFKDITNSTDTEALQKLFSDELVSDSDDAEINEMNYTYLSDVLDTLRMRISNRFGLIASISPADTQADINRLVRELFEGIAARASDITESNAREMLGFLTVSAFIMAGYYNILIQKIQGMKRYGTLYLKRLATAKDLDEKRAIFEELRKLWERQYPSIKQLSSLLDVALEIFRNLQRAIDIVVNDDSLMSQETNVPKHVRRALLNQLGLYFEYGEFTSDALQIRQEISHTLLATDKLRDEIQQTLSQGDLTDNDRDMLAKLQHTTDELADLISPYRLDFDKTLTAIQHFYEYEYDIFNYFLYAVPAWLTNEELERLIVTLEEYNVFKPLLEADNKNFDTQNNVLYSKQGDKRSVISPVNLVVSLRKWRTLLEETGYKSMKRENVYQYLTMAEFSPINIYKDVIDMNDIEELGVELPLDVIIASWEQYARAALHKVSSEDIYALLDNLWADIISFEQTLLNKDFSTFETTLVNLAASSLQGLADKSRNEAHKEIDQMMLYLLLVIDPALFGALISANMDLALQFLGVKNVTELVTILKQDVENQPMVADIQKAIHSPVNLGELKNLLRRWVSMALCCWVQAYSDATNVPLSVQLIIDEISEHIPNFRTSKKLKRLTSNCQCDDFNAALWRMTQNTTKDLATAGMIAPEWKDELKDITNAYLDANAAHKKERPAAVLYRQLINLYNIVRPSNESSTCFFAQDGLDNLDALLADDDISQ